MIVNGERIVIRTVRRERVATESSNLNCFANRRSDGVIFDSAHEARIVAHTIRVQAELSRLAKLHERIPNEPSSSRRR